jgi:curved DNA-binding protein CbpA
VTSRYYSLLGLEKGADRESIKQAFRRLAVVFHPDKGQVHRQRFTEICEAYHALMALDAPTKAAQVKAAGAGHSINSINQKALQLSQDRRFGRRGSPGDRRFECVLEQQYKGRHLKVTA